ncbi:hypothetical protein ES703_104459 [subsurface metagenome]
MAVPVVVHVPDLVAPDKAHHVAEVIIPVIGSVLTRVAGVNAFGHGPGVTERPIPVAGKLLLDKQLNTVGTPRTGVDPATRHIAGIQGGRGVGNHHVVVGLAIDFQGGAQVFPQQVFQPQHALIGIIILQVASLIPSRIELVVVGRLIVPARAGV